MNDNVNHPSHYTDGKIEVINFIEDKNLNFHRGNAVKYIARAGKKNPEKEVEDLEKAVWYTNREIQRINGQSKNSVLLEHLEALKKFINGEWVDTDITIDNICRLCRLHSGKKTPCETPCKEWNDLLDNLLKENNSGGQDYERTRNCP